MPTVTLHESTKSREQLYSYDGQNETTIVYVATGSDNEFDVDAAVRAEIPAFYLDQPFLSYEKFPQGGGVWEVVARYGKKGTEPEFAFDTTGGQERVFSAFSSAYYAGGNYPADYRGLINVHDNSVDGVDVTVPKFGFTLKRFFRHPLPGSAVDALHSLSGSVNIDVVNVTIRGMSLTFQPGELLFLGALGGLKGQEMWEVTLRFAASKNAILTFGHYGQVCPTTPAPPAFAGCAGTCTFTCVASGEFYDLTNCGCSVGCGCLVGWNEPCTPGSTFNQTCVKGDWLQQCVTTPSPTTVTTLPCPTTPPGGTTAPGGTTTTPGPITVFKRGWDYLWIQYLDIVDPNARALVKVPVQVNVEQVYPMRPLQGLFN